MVLDWPDRRCIVCLSSSGEPSKAHVIPASVGGTLQVPFLCSACNSQLGYGPEAALKRDPSVALAIDHLAKVLSTIDWMRKRRIYFADEDGVRVRARLQGGEFEVLDSPQENGSRVKSQTKALLEIETSLRRSGATQEEIEVARQRYEHAPNGVKTQISSGLSIKKGQVTGFVPNLRSRGDPGKHIADVETSVLAMAYLYLAVHLGRTIYHEGLRPIREALLGNDCESQWLVVASWAKRGYQPWHGLSLKAEKDRTVIEVRLFGALSWLVSLESVSVASVEWPSSYRVDLVTGQEFWSVDAHGEREVSCLG